MTLIPWEDILFVRPSTTEDLTYTGNTKGEPRIEALDLRLKDQSSILLREVYTTTMNSLYNLIDPPAECVDIAIQAMENGRSVEDAAMDAGLF